MSLETELRWANSDTQSIVLLDLLARKPVSSIAFEYAAVNFLFELIFVFSLFQIH